MELKISSSGKSESERLISIIQLGLLCEYKDQNYLQRKSLNRKSIEIVPFSMKVNVILIQKVNDLIKQTFQVFIRLQLLITLNLINLEAK